MIYCQHVANTNSVIEMLYRDAELEIKRKYIRKIDVFKIRPKLMNRSFDGLPPTERQPGGTFKSNGVESIRNDRFGEAFLYALPWQWSASGAKRADESLQLRAAGDFPRMLFPFQVLLYQREVYEQG